MKGKNWLRVLVCLAVMVEILPVSMHAQQDPGPRAGAAGAEVIFVTWENSRATKAASGLDAS